MTPDTPFATAAADGTDPRLLARVVAWIARHGHTPAELTRRVATALDQPQLAAGDDLSGAGTAGAVLRQLVAHVPVDDDVRAVAHAWDALSVTAAVVGDPAYPRRLTAGWPGTGGPPLLAWRGSCDGIPDVPTVAIVGARNATPYGAGVAAWLAEAAALAGILVVSGGAVGIDAAAHRGARGRTVVVLGCGHDVGYPRAHAVAGGLFDQVVEAGGAVASELLPGTPPTPPRVKARNRIVAGLADAVVVVEGGSRSGALVTAGEAAERGLPVLAVPGDVRAPGSAAPHRLLSEGAWPCTSPQDLCAAVGAAVGAAGDDGDGDGPTPSLPTVLPAPVHAELRRRWPRPVRVEDLATTAATPIGPLLAALTRAHVAGEIAHAPDGVRLTRRP